MASPGEPMGSKMPPERDLKSSKNGLLRPASPRRPPKPPPRSKKPPKPMENLHKTASRPRGKNRGSGALQRTGSQVCPRTSRKKSRWWHPSEDKIAGVFADLVENIGAPHPCTHPPSAADWAKPNWIIWGRRHGRSPFNVICPYLWKPFVITTSALFRGCSSCNRLTV